MKAGIGSIKAGVGYIKAGVGSFKNWHSCLVPNRKTIEAKVDNAVMKMVRADTLKYVKARENSGENMDKIYPLYLSRDMDQFDQLSPHAYS